MKSLLVFAVLVAMVTAMAVSPEVETVDHSIEPAKTQSQPVQVQTPRQANLPPSSLIGVHKFEVTGLTWGYGPSRPFGGCYEQGCACETNCSMHELKFNMTLDIRANGSIFQTTEMTPVSCYNSACGNLYVTIGFFAFCEYECTNASTSYFLSYNNNVLMSTTNPSASYPVDGEHRYELRAWYWDRVAKNGSWATIRGALMDNDEIRYVAGDESFLKVPMSELKLCSYWNFHNNDPQYSCGSFIELVDLMYVSTFVELPGDGDDDGDGGLAGAAAYQMPYFNVVLYLAFVLVLVVIDM